VDAGYRWRLWFPGKGDFFYFTQDYEVAYNGIGLSALSSVYELPSLLNATGV